jgi:hypothetical protein
MVPVWESTLVAGGRTRGRLVEPAKADELEKLGEGHRARGIAKGWVRTKLASKTGVTDGVASPDAP